MILKITGALIVVISSYIAGIYCSKRSWFRNQDLEQLKKAITIFRGEVLYSCAPIDEIFAEISERTNGVVSLLFNQVSQLSEKRTGEMMSEIWDCGVASILPNSYFSGEDLEYIHSFGRTLGYSDKNQQDNNALILLEYIENAQKDIREKKSTEEKLYKSLGLMCGLAISIVLF